MLYAPLHLLSAHYCRKRSLKISTILMLLVFPQKVLDGVAIKIMSGNLVRKYRCPEICKIMTISIIGPITNSTIHSQCQ